MDCRNRVFNHRKLEDDCSDEATAISRHRKQLYEFAENLCCAIVIANNFEWYTSCRAVRDVMMFSEKNMRGS